jgi:DNA-binding MarR family transcriptional regulator
MSDILKLAEKEITRREILNLCQVAAPEGCSPNVLQAALKKTGITPEDIRQELHYLEGKGLLKKKTVENERLCIRRDIYSITSEGTDYLDGTGPDIPGIGV